jgi:hypothetical protein
MPKPPGLVVKKESKMRSAVADNDMIYAASREEIEVRRKAFLRKWRLKHSAVAESLQENRQRRLTL